MGPSGAVQTAPGGEAPGRSPADVSALLVELGRAARSLQLYPDGHPARKTNLERAWGCWKADLGRHGPLAVEMRRGGFWLAGSDVPLGRGRLDELARELSTRGVRRLEVTPELDLPAFGALAGLLGTDPDELLARGGIGAALAEAGHRGLLLDGLDPAAWLAAREGSPQPVPAADPHDTTVPEIPPPPAPAEPVSAAPEAPAPDPEAELAARLSALEATSAPARYAELAGEIVHRASALAAAERPEPARTALDTLDAHVRDAARDEALREAAREARDRLASTPALLAELIRAASAPSGDQSLRAGRLLHGLGAAAAPSVLDAFVAARDAPTRGALAGVLVSLGTAAVPALERALAGSDPARTRAAIRLAGETRATALVPALRALLESADEAVRRDTARALAQIGDERAFAALVSMLEHPARGAAELAAFCLGATGRPEALRPLVQLLDRALAARDTALGLEAVRALGRLGRPECAAPLATLLQRRSFRFRAGLRELHACAVEALARLPGPRARGALAGACAHPTREVRDLAERLLARRDAEPSRR